MRRGCASRRCYDHLGGRLGAGLLALYLEKGWLEKEPGASTAYQLTDSGRKAFGSMGLPPEYLRAGHGERPAE